MVDISVVGVVMLKVKFKLKHSGLFHILLQKMKVKSESEKVKVTKLNIKSQCECKNICSVTVHCIYLQYHMLCKLHILWEVKS